MLTLLQLSVNQVAEQQATYASPSNINDALGEALVQLAVTINGLAPAVENVSAETLLRWSGDRCNGELAVYVLLQESVPV